jgi:hypothetical protein
MPEKKTIERAQRDKKEGKAPSSQAGKFVREEMDHIREGKHGARSAKQAIAIGLSKARRAGVKLPPRPGQKETKATSRKPNPKRSQATLHALKREGTAAASHTALSRHAHASAEQRGHENLSRAAQKAVRTKGAEGRHEAAVKAARTRAKNTSSPSD